MTLGGGASTLLKGVSDELRAIQPVMQPAASTLWVEGGRSQGGGSTVTLNLAHQLLPVLDAIGPIAQWTEAHPPYRERFPITGSLGGQYQLRQPISVHLWLEGTEFVAAADVVDVHAFGRTREEALANLVEEIVEHVRFLNELGDRIVPRAARKRAVLNRLLYRHHGDG